MKVKIKWFYIVLIPVFLLACNNKAPASGSVVGKVGDSLVRIIGERIDGPANVRSTPGGEVLFTLDDNVLADIGLAKSGWHEIVVFADIDSSESHLDSIRAGRDIIIGGKKSGRILKTHWVGTSIGKGTWAMLYGYIHKNNIRPETVIETRLAEQLRKSGRKLRDWKDFIYLFDLERDTLRFPPFNAYFNYENGVDDPSPGFRVMLLFENDLLYGIMHTRDIDFDELSVMETEGIYKVSFYRDYPQEKQRQFVRETNKWLQMVD